MTNPDYTHLALIIDRSGSMSDMASEAENGINTLLKEQFAEPGKFTYTLTQFDDKIETVSRMRKSRKKYTLEPRSLTALFDAVGTEIVKTGADLAKLPEDERPGRVIVLIVTDGMENASHEYTSARIREMIAQQRDVYSWQFQFLGAGESAFQADEIGAAKTAYVASDAGIRGVYKSATDTMKAYRAAPLHEAKFEMPESVEEDL
jgi:von Willebrand factor type A domain